MYAYVYKAQVILSVKCIYLLGHIMQGNVMIRRVGSNPFNVCIIRNCQWNQEMSIN